MIDLPRQVKPKPKAPTGYLYLWQVLDKLGCSRPTLYRKIADGLLPSPSLEKWFNKSVWAESEIERYIKTKLGA